RLGAQLDESEWPTVLFSAKEAIYKAWWPVHRRWLGYEDADVTVDLAAGTFTARILVDHDPVFARLAGRVAIAGDLVLAAAGLPRGPGGCGRGWGRPRPPPAPGGGRHARPAADGDARSGPGDGGGAARRRAAGGAPRRPPARLRPARCARPRPEPRR